MSDKKLFLLDGMALVYRGHFALIRNPRITSTGDNVSAVFAFANTLMDIFSEEPSHMAVVFDTPEPTFRHKQYSEYKAQREAMPEDLSAALPQVFELCEAFNLKVLRQPGWEADDIIGTLARLAEKDAFTTYMVTPDKDYGQLVDANTYMCKPGRSGGKLDLMGVEEILARWQIERIDQVIDILGLMGDASDNVPGVPGIGEKTAQKLIAEFGSVENLLENLDQIKGKRRQVLEDNREQAILSKELVTIDCQVPIEVELEDLKRPKWDEGRLKKLFVELEFNTLGKRLFGEDFSAAPRRGAPTEEEMAEAGLKTIADVEHSYEAVEGPQARKALIETLLQQKSFCFDVETTGLDVKTCDLLGLAFSYAPQTGYYVPLTGTRQDIIAVLEEFNPLWQATDIEKVGHNLKYDLGVLRWHGFRVEGPFFDTMLAAHLAAPELRRSMDYLAQAFLSYKPVSITELIGERGEDQLNMADVPLEQVVQYASEDADITLQLAAVLRPLVEEKGQQQVFGAIECPLLPVLVEMEYEGIRMDVGAIETLSKELAGEIEAAAERIYTLGGERFNLNSAQQLGELLFGKLELDPNARRTQKTGQFQTNEQILRRLAPKHEIVERVLDYRMFSKLKSTYVDMLPGSVFATSGRVHTHYDQAVAATGRMQSHGPNLQTIPVRSERGREIRRAFVPRSEEYTLLSADYSQIELRIAAELSGDQELRRTFVEGGDIHTDAAMKINGVAAEEVTAEMRRRAKTVNFGIIYGISAFGLAERLDIPRGQASELIEQYFAQYAGVKNYMEQTIEMAREKGYVETVTGRRRFLRDINSRNATTRKGAERNAINTPIQGTGADMIKLAMNRIHKLLLEGGFKTKMLLQVHDELVFDLHRDEAETLPPLVEEAMRTALPMEVPILVEMGTGANWLVAH